MNRETIRQTAICRYDRSERSYIVQSPLLEICIGAAARERDAWAIFNDLLEAMYLRYLEGRIVGKYKRRGRPRKGGIQFHAAIRPATKDTLKDLAEKVGCSQGEIVDYLAAFYNAQNSRSPVVRETIDPWTAKKTSKKRSVRN